MKITFRPNPVVVEAVVGVRRDSHHPYYWTAECDCISVIAPPKLAGCGDGGSGRGETRSEAILECLRRTLAGVSEIGARLLDDIQTFEPRVTLVVHVNDETPLEALVTRVEREYFGQEPTRAERGAR